MHPNISPTICAGASESPSGLMALLQVFVSSRVQSPTHLGISHKY